ncbi:hypothetical protein CEXT_224801 [Caerostris extrusa]|uniref:Uncharacterized protein n=1 Tax=Caerostris extrusa TaxID=172846 RepID=A0AAV4NH13_CAEEX|nr:hypothetical protein CEXT_224801 [Caerostris extrusa]
MDNNLKANTFTNIGMTAVTAPSLLPWWSPCRHEWKTIFLQGSLRFLEGGQLKIAKRGQAGILSGGVSHHSKQICFRMCYFFPLVGIFPLVLLSLVAGVLMFLEEVFYSVLHQCLLASGL